MNTKYFAVQEFDKSFRAYGPCGTVMHCNETCDVVIYCNLCEDHPQYAKLKKACLQKAIEVSLNPN